MFKPLEDILKVPGITSIFITNNRGTIIDAELDSLMDNDFAEELARNIIKIFAIGKYGKFDRQSKEIELLFGEGRIIAVDCKQFVIIIICSKKTPVSMLRLTLGVQQKNLLEDKKLSKILDKEVIDKKILLRKANLTQKEIELLERV